MPLWVFCCLFVWWWYWGLNSGWCKVGALRLEPCPQPILVWLFCFMRRLGLPFSYLCFLGSWDDWCVLLNHLLSVEMESQRLFAWAGLKPQSFWSVLPCREACFASRKPWVPSPTKTTKQNKTRSLFQSIESVFLGWWNGSGSRVPA
jgi:hypothetical protein